MDTAYLQASSTALTAGHAMWYGIGFKSLDSSSMSAYVKVDIEMITRFEQPQQQIGS